VEQPKLNGSVQLEEVSGCAATRRCQFTRHESSPLA
jgi:hypothetical protein